MLSTSTSIAAVYGTICSLVWESRGSPELWYASNRKPRGEENKYVSFELRKCPAIIVAKSSKLANFQFIGHEFHAHIPS